MKKVLLSLSMLAAVMSANAQTNVGVGAYDDFNQAGEYGTATSGLYWFSDAVWTQFYPNFDATSGSPATPTRRTGTQMVFTVNKAANYTLSGSQTDDNAKYSPFGLSFGDDGATPPVDNVIDISGKKTLSVDLKAYKAVTVRVQLKDANDKTIEATAGTGASWSFDVTTTLKTFTLDISNGVALDWSSGSAVDVTGFDYTKVSKVLFFVDPGFAGTDIQPGSTPSGQYGAGFQPSTFNGAVTMDNFKVGTTAVVGLGTQSAAANIASTKVFPNPATAGFTAEVNLKNAASTTVILSDMMGKQIAVRSIENGSASFETAGLANGIYTVTYVVDGTPAKSELVVVK
ncbi:MAG: T9SS type A sorting domain-containing protein [Cytophaga sp.]|uniref:T9SS type A sorting domain-containing protein n=1 Tax=Cytophaga sp. TaxID=29535 RepID=UPI003F823035